jgi:hypothetical protein
MRLTHHGSFSSIPEWAFYFSAVNNNQRLPASAKQNPANMQATGGLVSA